MTKKQRVILALLTSFLIYSTAFANDLNCQGSYNAHDWQDANCYQVGDGTQNDFFAVKTTYGIPIAIHTFSIPLEFTPLTGKLIFTTKTQSCSIAISDAGANQYWSIDMDNCTTAARDLQSNH